MLKFMIKTSVMAGRISFSFSKNSFTAARILFESALLPSGVTKSVRFTSKTLGVIAATTSASISKSAAINKSDETDGCFVNKATSRLNKLSTSTNCPEKTFSTHLTAHENSSSTTDLSGVDRVSALVFAHS